MTELKANQVQEILQQFIDATHQISLEKPLAREVSEFSDSPDPNPQIKKDDEHYTIRVFASELDDSLGERLSFLKQASIPVSQVSECVYEFKMRNDSDLLKLMLATKHAELHNARQRAEIADGEIDLTGADIDILLNLDPRSQPAQVTPDSISKNKPDRGAGKQ